MGTDEATEKKPLWLLIEENILKLDSQALTATNQEASIKSIAREIDNAGQNVSKHGGNLLQLRWALEDATKVGKPLMQDFNAAIDALKLEELTDHYAVASQIIDDIGKTWPKFKQAARRPDIIKIIEEKRLDLLVAKAKGMPDNQGIRLLIGEKIEDEVIISKLEITAEQLKEVHAAIKKELAERERVVSLLEKVEGKTDDERIRHLLTNDVAENLIIELAKVDQAAIDASKKAMEKELAEKQRQAEEEAKRKAEQRKKEAEGPALEDIPSDQMIDYIDAIREIMEFSEEEKEIRIMCEQSAIPKALVDIAVSDPDKLDEMEKQAEG